MRLGLTVGSTVAIRLAMERARDKEADSLAADLFNGVKSRTPVRSGAAKRAWTKRKQGDSYVINNPKPYSGRLDNGYSRQAPEGMTRPTIRSLRLRGKLK
jgi:hypothetical protein